MSCNVALTSPPELLQECRSTIVASTDVSLTSLITVSGIGTSALALIELDTLGF